MPTDSYSSSVRREILDGPPPGPPHRTAPRDGSSGRGLSSLSGKRDGRASISSPEGEYDERDDPETGLTGPASVVEQMFAYTAGIEHFFKLLVAVAPEVGAVAQDLVTLLRQVVPQAAAAKLSGQPLGLPPGAGAPMSSGMMGTPQPAGLSMLSGMGAGAGGGMMPAAPPDGGGSYLM